MGRGGWGASRAPGEGEQDPAESILTGREIRRKAAHGVLFVSLRSFAVRGLGLLGSLILARLLLPRDFGVLAFGQTLIAFGGFFADAGIAAG
jgi:O-antigen/teichoic acid export membrane protein